MFNATLNIIVAISWLSALLMEETEVLRNIHRHAASHYQIYHILLYQVHLAMSGKTHTLK
jgi:hypothetical protein